MEKDFYYKKDKLNQLRGFCSVVQCNCSISKAADKLGLEQPAISKQISALERDLGIELFDRKSKYKRLILTDEGKRFYEECIGIVQSVDGLYQNFATKVKNEKNNVLKIGGTTTVFSYILPKYIKKLIKKPEFKNLVIEICDIPGEEALKRLINKEIDIAFYGDKIKGTNNDISQPEISKHLYKIDSGYLFFDKNHPIAKIKNITKTDVEKYPFIFLKKYYSTDPKKLFNLTKNNLIFEKFDWNLIKEYVYETENIVLLTESFYKENKKYDKRFCGINLASHNILVEMCYFILNNNIQKPALKSLIEMIEKDKKYTSNI